MVTIMSAFSKANFPSTSFDFEDSTRGEVLKLTKVVVRFMFLYGADYSDKETQTSSNNRAKLFLSPAANIVFLILLIFLIFQILFRIHLVSVIKCY